MDFDTKESILMSDTMKQSNQNFNNEQMISTTSKSIHNMPCHFPYSTQNPYDDGLFSVFFVFSIALLIILIDISLSEKAF
jgi:hypothetical protein